MKWNLLIAIIQGILFLALLATMQITGDPLELQKTLLLLLEALSVYMTIGAEPLLPQKGRGSPRPRKPKNDIWVLSDLTPIDPSIVINGAVNAPVVNGGAQK